jgi:hypothetical protein
MARELVTRQGVGEQAEQVWRSLQRERKDPVPPVPMPAFLDIAAEAPVIEVEPMLWTPRGGKPEQLSLF